MRYYLKKSDQRIHCVLWPLVPVLSLILHTPFTHLMTPVLLAKMTLSQVLFSLLLTFNLCLSLTLPTTTVKWTTNGTSAPPNVTGIDIPYIMAKSACNPGQQPQVESHLLFGYLVSPDPDLLKNQTEFNCTWLLRVAFNQTIKSTIMNFDLAGSALHVDFHDGTSVQAPLIGSYHGRMARVFFQTKTNSLFVRYYGHSSLASISQFYAYVEESPPRVTCHNATMIQCRNGLACVPLSNKCDGTDHCGDGTTEQECPHEQLYFTRPCGLKNEVTEQENMRIVGGKASLPSK